MNEFICKGLFRLEYLLYLILCLFLFQPVSAEEMLGVDDIVFICNRDVFHNSLSKSDIQKIFLGKKTTWDDRKDLIVFTMKPSELHSVFLREYIGRSQQQYKNYWKQLLFIGKGTPPRSFKSEAGIIEKVKNTSGAIAYVSKNADISSVKKINIE